MKWKFTKMENGSFLYEQESPKPLDFTETYILLSAVVIVALFSISILLA